MALSSELKFGRNQLLLSLTKINNSRFIKLKTLGGENPRRAAPRQVPLTSLEASGSEKLTIAPPFYKGTSLHYGFSMEFKEVKN